VTAILSSILFIGALPPFSIPVIGVFFMIPLLLEDKSCKNNFLFSLVVSSYVYFGVWSYDPLVYCYIVLLFSIVFYAFLLLSIHLLSINHFYAITLIPLTWVFIELIFQHFHIPVTLSVLLTPQLDLLSSAQFGGQYLLSYFLVGFQVGLTILYKQLFITKIYNKKSLISVFLLFAGIIFSTLYSPVKSTDSTAVTISIVQTNTHPRETTVLAADGIIEKLQAHRLSLLDNIAKSEFNPDLIVWPEVSLAKFEFRNLDNISQDAAKHNISMLIASPDMDTTGNTYQSVFSISSSGEILERFNKNYLIPLLETSSGHNHQWGVHEGLPGKPGSIICYESLFSYPAVMRSRAGAGFITLSTNDAYAGPSILPLLHLEFSKIKAVETGKTIIRAANAGPSAVIDSSGKILQQLAMFTAGSINTTLQPDYRQTFFTRHYYSVTYFYWLASSLAFFLSIIVIIKSVKITHTAHVPAPRDIILFFGFLVFSLTYQYLHIGNLYEKNTGSSLPDKFIHFQNGLVPESTYKQLMVNTPEDSILASVVYLLRDFGNNLTLIELETELQHGHSKQSVNLADVFDRYGYNSNSTTYEPALHFEKYDELTSSLTLLKSGETVCITQMDINQVSFFSPYYGKILSINTDAFLNSWTGKVISLSTREKSWDI